MNHKKNTAILIILIGEIRISVHLSSQENKRQSKNSLLIIFESVFLFLLAIFIFKSDNHKVRFDTLRDRLDVHMIC